jgi:hypothetical protein
MTCDSGFIRTWFHVHTEKRIHVCHCIFLTRDKISWNEEGVHSEEKGSGSSSGF